MRFTLLFVCFFIFAQKEINSFTKEITHKEKVNKILTVFFKEISFDSSKFEIKEIFNYDPNLSHWSDYLDMYKKKKEFLDKFSIKYENIVKQKLVEIRNFILSKFDYKDIELLYNFSISSSNLKVQEIILKFITKKIIFETIDNSPKQNFGLKIIIFDQFLKDQEVEQYIFELIESSPIRIK